MDTFHSFARFNAYSELKYGFSEKKNGSMNRRLEKENRDLYFRSIVIAPENVVTADLVHGTNVEIVRGATGVYVANTDALVTNVRNLFLSVTGADCFAVYFYDPQKKVVGIAHVGWRGLLAGIIKNTVEVLIKNFDTLPQDLLIGVSPGIRECHFEISPDDVIKYREYAGFISKKKEKTFVDLDGIIARQLIREGVLKDNIQASGLCTHCEDRDFFSYRRDKPQEVQVMVAYIGLA